MGSNLWQQQPPCIAIKPISAESRLRVSVTASIHSFRLRGWLRSVVRFNRLLLMLVSSARLARLLLDDLVMLRRLLVDLLCDDELSDFVRQRLHLSLVIDLITLIVFVNWNTPTILFDAFGLTLAVLSVE